MRKTFLSKILGAAGMSTLIWAAPALAQEDSPSAQGAAAAASTPIADVQGGLEDIVVTAQKRSENLQDVPISVTAVDGNVLSSASVEAQASLPRLTPNLAINTFSGYVSPYLRGIGTAFANPGLEQSVATYFDDQYMPRSSSGYFTFNDIERIEVLKGPQGTLYGRNATGGALRVISREPIDRFEANAQIAYGNLDRFLIEGMVNVPIAPDLALRVNARHDERDGYVRNILGGPRLNSRNEEFVRAKLLWTPTDRLSIKLTGDYLYKHDREGQAFLALFDSAPEQIGVALGGVTGGFHETATNLTDPATRNLLKAGGAALRVDYELDGLTLSSITGYRYNFERSFGDLDGTSANFQQAFNTGVVTRVYTQEFQAVSDNAGPLQYTFGAFYLHESAFTDFGIFGSSIGAGLALGSVGKVTVDSIAPYAQVSYAISDQFEVLVGARYTMEKKTLERSAGYLGAVDERGVPTGPRNFAPESCVGPGVPAVIVCTSEERSLSFSQFTPRVTLTYRPVDDIMVYGTYSRGFKSGGFNLPAFAWVDEVDPEVLDAFELGAKMEFGRVRLNLAGFHYDDKNIQVQLTDQATGAQRTRNAASAKIQGVEAELTWAATRHLVLAAGGGYLDATYSDYIGDGYVPCSQAAVLPQCVAQGGLGLGLVTNQDFAGNRLTNAPKVGGFVRAEFTQPLPGGSEIQIAPLVSYQSRTYWDDANTFSQKGRVLVSGTIGWRAADERLSVTLYGDNLLDKRYLTHVAPQVAGGWRTPGAPRTYGIRLGYGF